MSTYFKSTVAERVKWMREKRGISQEILAEKSEISTKEIGEIERGVGNPTLKTMCKIAQAMNFEPYIMLVPMGQSPLEKLEELLEKHTNQIVVEFGGCLRDDGQD